MMLLDLFMSVKKIDMRGKKGNPYVFKLEISAMERNQKFDFWGQVALLSSVLAIAATGFDFVDWQLGAMSHEHFIGIIKTSLLIIMCGFVVILIGKKSWASPVTKSNNMRKSARPRTHPKHRMKR